MSRFVPIFLSFVLLAATSALAADGGGAPAEAQVVAAKGAPADDPQAGLAPAKNRLALTLPIIGNDPALGLELADSIDPFVAAIGLTGESGALVVGVRRGSAAARAGMLPGDLVVAAAGAEIRDAADLRIRLRQLDAEVADATVIRIGAGPDDLIAQLRTIAASGNRDATLALGDVSLFNLDRLGEPENAEAFYERAFEMGDARAAYRLGQMYATGKGVSIDLAVATRWYRLAAEAGVPAGQHALGLTWWTGRYWTGLALVTDYTEAVSWLRRAADRGHAPSYIYLGLARQFGSGIEQDYELAADWYRKAAMAGEVEALVRLADMDEAGQRGDPDPDRALELFREAALQGSVEANRRLGERFWRGEGVRRHPLDAVAYLRTAAAQGDAASMALIAEILLSGYGVTRDEPAAIGWYFQAYQAGDPDAGFALALAYADGIGVERDMSKVAGFMLDAIRRGSRPALAEMKGNAEGWNIAVREELQRLLKASGLYTGEIDGVFGPGTLRALDAAAAG